MDKKSSAPTEVATTYFETDRDLGKWVQNLSTVFKQNRIPHGVSKCTYGNRAT